MKYTINTAFLITLRCIRYVSLKMLLLLMVITASNSMLAKSKKYQHLIIYGQSLSTGHQSWPALSTNNVSGNYMIGNQVWTNFGNVGYSALNPLVANIAASTIALPKTRASNIYAENPLVAATNHIQLKTKRKYKFIASSCGTGGLTIEQLSKEYYNPTFYKNFTNTIDYAASITSRISCPAIFWMQGEYNYAPTSKSLGLTVGSVPTADKNNYKSLLLKLKENMQNDIFVKYKQTNMPLFITYQVGAQYSRGKELSIGMAQLEASNENNDIICAGPIYQMTDRGGHLDSNGYRWFGEILGKVYYRTIILGEDFKPLQPIEISRTDNTKVLKIKFYVPKLPLVLDELLVKKIKDYGFEIYDDNIKKTIQNIKIDADCVLITTTTDLVGTLEVIYAGTSNYGDGNLRDSDNELAYYNYVDLDKTNADGTYVFERDTTETKLRPSFEPKDEQGVIYEKPYPLYNFSLAFYYTLLKDTSTFRIPKFQKKIKK